MKTKPRMLDLCCRVDRCAKLGQTAKLGEFITVTGNCSGADYARAAMGIDTQFIGEQLIK